MDQRLWQSIIDAERRGPDGAASPLGVLVTAGKGADARRALGRVARENGAPGPVRRGGLRLTLPASRALELGLRPGLEVLPVAAAPPKAPPGRAARLAAASLLAVALGGGGLWWAVGQPGPPPDPGGPGQVRGMELDALYQSGIMAYKLGNVEAAVVSWKKILQADPGRTGVRRIMGWALYELGRGEEAAAQFEAILRTSPDDEEAIIALELMQKRPRPEPPAGQ